VLGPAIRQQPAGDISTRSDCLTPSPIHPLPPVTWFHADPSAAAAPLAPMMVSGLLNHAPPAPPTRPPPPSCSPASSAPASASCWITSCTSSTNLRDIHLRRSRRRCRGKLKDILHARTPGAPAPEVIARSSGRRGIHTSACKTRKVPIRIPRLQSVARRINRAACAAAIARPAADLTNYPPARGPLNARAAGWIRRAAGTPRTIAA